MDWLKVKIYTTPKGCEIVSAALYAMGIYVLEIFNPDDYKMPQKDYTWDYIDEEVLEKQQEEAYVCAYVGDTASGVEQLCEIRSAMERIKREISDIDLGRLAIEVSNMKNEDWTNNWKKFFKPMDVGESFIVTPEWEIPSNPHGKSVLVVNPGGIFGSGSHETTQLCICAIERESKQIQGEKGAINGILDIGTGTGILSIAAIMKGAKQAVCVDIDPNAREIVEENMEMNGIEKSLYTVKIGNILDESFAEKQLVGQKFDIAVANIMADIIIELLPAMPQYMTENGVFIMSGIIEPRLEAGKNAAVSAGLEVTGEEISGEWCCVCARLKK